jgi:formylglycine-generating enzyme required for sulfatase activity
MQRNLLEFNLNKQIRQINKMKKLDYKLQKIRKFLTLLVVGLLVIKGFNFLPIKEGLAAVKYVIDSNDEVSGLTATGVLNIGSAAVDGFLRFFPTANAPTANEGAMYYDSTLDKIRYYTGSRWISLAANSDFTCPTGYIAVPGSSTFGTDGGFCVMKYEAKQDANKNPTSTATGTPWVSVDWHEAKQACKRVGAHLITPGEWMTIARNAEAVAGNWTGGSVGSGYLFAGHNDNAPAAAKAASATDTGNYRCAYTDTAGTTENPSPCPTNTASGTSGTAGNQVRTLTLSNGNIIWDFSGNVWEWIDMDMTALGIWYASPDWVEWNNANLTDYEQIVAGSTSYTSASGVGQYCSSAGARAARRGGGWSDGVRAGAFTLVLTGGPSVVKTRLGFRCAK